MRIHRFHGLSAGMADLRPEMIAIAGSSGGPAPQRARHFIVRHGIDDDIAGPFQMIGVNLDIPRKVQPRAAIRPNAVQFLELLYNGMVRGL